MAGGFRIYASGTADARMCSWKAREAATGLRGDRPEQLRAGSDVCGNGTARREAGVHCTGSRVGFGHTKPKMPTRHPPENMK